jgi:type IV pilus assembly protein PilP
MWQAAVVGASVLVAGCFGGDMSDLEQRVAQVKARQSPKIEEIPPMTPPEFYAYASSAKTDPFRSLPQEEEQQEKVGRQGEGPAPPRDHVREELEYFPLDSLRMVGTLQQEDELWGLVTAPDRAVHRVQVGNYVGKNYGKVTVVAEDRIELVEIIPNGQDGWDERPARLDLKE